MQHVLGTWLEALRAEFLTATLVPVVLGTVLARDETGSLHPAAFVLGLIGACCLHLGANLTNDYFDDRSGNDNHGKGTPFSGGSQVIQQGRLPARHVLVAAYTCFALGSSIGLALAMWLNRFGILGIGLLGALLGYFYTAQPLRIGYRGAGELCTGFVFGPLITLGAYELQTGTISARSAVVSLFPALLISLVLLINEFPDRANDARVGKRTLVVRIGTAGALRVFRAGMAILYLLLPVMVAAGCLPLTCLVCLVTLPLAWRILQRAREGNAVPLDVNRNTIILHLTFGLLLAAGIAAG